jgi:hypothetical protein
MRLCFDKHLSDMKRILPNDIAHSTFHHLEDNFALDPSGTAKAIEEATQANLRFDEQFGPDFVESIPLDSDDAC